jgi:hypothetical protein
MGRLSLVVASTLSVAFLFFLSFIDGSDSFSQSAFSRNLQVSQSQFLEQYGYSPDHFSSVFLEHAFPFSSFTKYDGQDFTSLFANSVAASDKFLVVGSHGYSKKKIFIMSFLFVLNKLFFKKLDLYSGMVRIFEPLSASEWKASASIYSPLYDANFGISVDIDGDVIVVGANAVGWCFYFCTMRWYVI